jgi:hypothetical protein
MFFVSIFTKKHFSYMAEIFDLPTKVEQPNNPNERSELPTSTANAVLFDVNGNGLGIDVQAKAPKTQPTDYVKIPRKHYDLMRRRMEDFEQLQEDLDVFTDITRRIMFFLNDFPNHADSLGKVIDYYISISEEIKDENGEIQRVITAKSVGVTGLFRMPFADIMKVSGATNLLAFDGFAERLTPEAFAAFEAHQIPIPEFQKLMPILQKLAKKTEQITP